MKCEFKSDNLRKLRQWRNLTMTQLAEKAGVSASQICRWENGEWIPRLRNQRSLAKALNVPLNKLSPEVKQKIPV